MCGAAGTGGYRDHCSLSLLLVVGDVPKAGALPLQVAGAVVPQGRALRTLMRWWHLCTGRMPDGRRCPGTVAAGGSGRRVQQHDEWLPDHVVYNEYLLHYISSRELLM